MKIKTGDKVTVIAGANKGKDGKVIKVLGDKVIIEGVNIVTKHVKPKNNNGNGEIVKTEAPLHRSNVKVVESVKSKKTTKKAETKKEVKKEAKSTKKSTKKASEKEEK
ncbi:MAG: 50S ribosomal protein L24 [Bacilli bacterium]|nr:50S ribosomal protein L24 [Bacilli bacterium]